MDVIQEPRSIRKNLARLAVPIFIETLLIMMLGAVDTVMLSQYSDNSVAAVGVVNQLIMFAFLIFEVINIGTYEVDWLDDDWTVVTRDGSLSAHYENTILITEGEPRILSLTCDNE